MADKPNLPALPGAGKQVSTTGPAGLPRLPGILPGTTPSVTGGTTQAVNTALAGMVHSQTAKAQVVNVKLLAALDYTASTTGLVTGFRSRVGDIIGEDRGNVQLDLYPAVFNGAVNEEGIGNAVAGAKGDAKFYETQPNVAGNTHITSGLNAWLRQNPFTPTSANIAMVLTDDTLIHDPNTFENTPGYAIHLGNVETLKRNNALLIVMIDSPNYEAYRQSYVDGYGTLGDNLIIIGGADDPKKVVDTFVAAKAKAQAQGQRTVDVRLMLPGLVKASPNLRIATGTSTGFIALTDERK